MPEQNILKMMTAAAPMFAIAGIVITWESIRKNWAVLTTVGLLLAAAVSFYGQVTRNSEKLTQVGSEVSELHSIFSEYLAREDAKHQELRAGIEKWVLNLREETLKHRDEKHNALITTINLQLSHISKSVDSLSDVVKTQHTELLDCQKQIYSNAKQ
jgi:predicted transcriptional regulator